MVDCGLFAKMKHRIALQAVSQASDSQGGYTETWATYATVWAYVRPVKGYERFQADQLQTPVTHKVTLRYRSDVTTAHQFIYDSRTFVIKEALNIDEANQYLELKAIERS